MQHPSLGCFGACLLNSILEVRRHFLLFKSSHQSWSSGRELTVRTSVQATRSICPGGWGGTFCTGLRGEGRLEQRWFSPKTAPSSSGGSSDLLKHICPVRPEGFKWPVTTTTIFWAPTKCQTLYTLCSHPHNNPAKQISLSLFCEGRTQLREVK